MCGVARRGCGRDVGRRSVGPSPPTLSPRWLNQRRVRSRRMKDRRCDIGIPSGCALEFCCRAIARHCAGHRSARLRVGACGEWRSGEGRKVCRETQGEGRQPSWTCCETAQRPKGHRPQAVVGFQTMEQPRWRTFDAPGSRFMGGSVGRSHSRGRAGGAASVAPTTARCIIGTTLLGLADTRRLSAPWRPFIEVKPCRGVYIGIDVHRYSNTDTCMCMLLVPFSRGLISGGMSSLQAHAPPLGPQMGEHRQGGALRILMTCLVVPEMDFETSCNACRGFSSTSGRHASRHQSRTARNSIATNSATCGRN